MADVRELFPILNDGALVGTSPDKAVDATTAAAALKGLVGFSFKNSAGNVVLPQLTADGKIMVDTESTAGECKSGHGEVSAGSLSLVDITGASYDFTTAQKTNNIGVTVACLRTSLFQIVYVDDAGGTPVETVIDEMLVGPGQFTIRAELGCLIVDGTAGTGTQRIKIKGQNLDKESSLRATVTGNVFA